MWKIVESVGISIATTIAIAILARLWGFLPDVHDYRIPSGTVSSFVLAKCPDGWQPYDSASGRFILGAGSLDSTPHRYGVGEQGGTRVTTVKGGLVTGDFGGTRYVMTKDDVDDVRNPFVALLFCQKL